MISIAIGGRQGLVFPQVANTLASIVISVKLHCDFHHKRSNIVVLLIN